MQMPTPIYCDEQIAKCQEMLARAADQETARKIAEAMRGWADLRAELEGNGEGRRSVSVSVGR